MAETKFITDINLNGNQIKQVNLEVLAEAPASASESRFYYDSTKKAIGFYTGTSWIYLGGNASEHGSVSAISKEGDVFTVSYADGSSEELKLMYESAMDDALTTPEKIGGLAKGTTAESLKAKTISQILDDILFEDVQPTVQNPSASISLKSGFASNGVYEVGAAAPQNPANFTTGFNRGTVTCPGRPNQNRAGELQSESSFIYYDNVASNTELPATIKLGATTYKYRAAYAEGDTLLTSKGNKASISPNPLTAGTVDSPAVTINGTYPYFCNGAQASENANAEAELSEVAPDTKLTLKTWTTTQIYAKFASEASTGTRLVFKYPAQKQVTAVEFLNTVSGKFEAFTGYTTSDAGNMQVQGQQVAYKQLTTTGALSGALKMRFTVANA